MMRRGVEQAVCILLVALALPLCGHGGRPHISNLNVLLPPRTSNPVRYRLQGTDGCFLWTWDHHDIISLEPEFNATTERCSTSAVITPLAPFEERQATAVHATDTITGEVLRCEIFIDRISRIQIFHHSVKLDLDGWATLRVRAFDAEENVFSSLVGLKFLWQLSTSGLESGYPYPQRLLHVALKDSPLSDCGSCNEIERRIELEEMGFGSDLYVVRGVSAGQETVSVDLAEPIMNKLKDSIVLTVAEAISLEPHSPLYIIPGTTFRFRLRAMRQNVLTEISLPSPHHQWFSTDMEVVTVDPHNGFAVAKSLGVTNIVVEDLRVKGHQQIATVHVVPPHRLELYLIPLSKRGRSHVPQDSKVSGAPWHVVTGREYVVLVRAFAPEARPLYLTQSNDLRLMFSNVPFWEVVEVPEEAASEHGWQNATLLRPLVEGTGTLIAKLLYEEDLDLKEVMREQLVNVCSQVTIILEHDRSSRVVLLPWSLAASQEYQLKAEGGCGEKLSDYVWSSSNTAVVTVNSLGKVYSKGPGSAAVRVSSAKDPLNSDEIQVEVSVPSAIGVVQGIPVEVEIQTILPVAITLTTPAGLPYSRCDGYNALVQWEILAGDGQFKFVDSSPVTLEDIFSYLLRSSQSSYQPICAWNTVLPSRPGRTSVTSSLKVSSVESPTFLEVSWTIAAYAPLALTQVSDGNCCGGYSCKTAAPSRSPCDGLKELLLVAGSGIKMILVGGPERWRQGPVFVELQEVFSDETGEKKPSDVFVQRTGDAGGKSFYISCYGLGNYTVMFRRGYQENEGVVNIVASTSLAVVCGAPTSIVLIIDEEDNKYSEIKSVIQMERDQERKRVTPVTVVNGRSIRVAAVALHASGKPFANASSLALSWQLEGCTDLAHWDENLDESWERSLGLGSAVGLCSVRATLTSLRHTKLPALTAQALTAEIDNNRMLLTDAAQLQLVTALRLDPKEILLFCHPEAKATFQVLGGTNDFETSVNDSKVAAVFAPTARSSSLVVAARAKGTALVTVVDIGLASPATATALVHVADIAWIKLTPDDVVLELGSVVEIHVQVGDSAGRIFHPSQYVLFNIRLHIQDEVIGLVNVTTKNQVLGNSFFIRGEALGLSSFHVSAEQASKREIHSEVVKAEVYAPIYIQPSPLVLAPGAQYMLVVHGGPTDGMVAEFSSPNTLVASVDPGSGLVIAKSVGNEIIVAKARGNDGRPLGEATTEVIVSLPVAMYLEVRSGQLGVGKEMSVFPYSSEGNLFSFYELCTAYEWSVSDPEVLQLESVSTPNSESRDSTWLVDTGFSARIIGKSPGRATVSVSFDCHFLGHSVPIKYGASETISVLPDPPLAVGMRATWVLPPNYRSSKLLPQRASDRLSSSRAITYSLLHDGGVVGGGDLLSISDGHIETADKMDVSCIHVRDRLAGRSEIAVCIRVAEVSQMTVGDDDFPFHVSELSVGTQQHFTVTLRDNIGTPYFEVNLDQMPLLIETNRPDVVSMKATSVESSGGSATVMVVVEALRQGKALIRISQKQKVDVADYILVFVGAYVHPRNPLMYVGDRINFSIAGKGLHAAGVPSTERGHWSSRNEYVVRINGRTGEAEAMSDGSTTVSFNGSRITAYTFVTVARVASIVVEAPHLQFLTNVPLPDPGYLFNVKFRDTQGRSVGDRAISYDCGLEPSIIGSVAPWHDSSTGNFYCVFTPHTPEKISYDVHHNPEHKKTATDLGNNEGILEMTVTVTIRRTPDVLGVATSTFAGGFSLIDAPSKLELSSRSNRTKISLVGSVGAVAVSWQRKDAVNVQALTKTKEFGIAGYAVYEVSLREEDKSFTDILAFLLTTTGYRVEIPMSYDAGYFYVAALSHQIVTVAIVTFVSIVVPLFLCTKLLDLPRPFKRPAASSMVAQVIQDGSPSGVLLNGSPSGVLLNGNVGSPHTPLHYRAYRRSPGQPYTDYMSRTIEQTPYFSRQTTRNTDPSRSY